MKKKKRNAYDVQVFAEQGGSFALLIPYTTDARIWLAARLADPCMFGNSYGVDIRYLPPILEGMREDGLVLGMVS